MQSSFDTVGGYVLDLSRQFERHTKQAERRNMETHSTIQTLDENVPKLRDGTNPGEQIRRRDVRTKHVISEFVPTLEHIRGLVVYGPTATLFTLRANNTVEQFYLSPCIMVSNTQHPVNLPPPPSVSEETSN
ncbi:IDC1 protein [Ilyonectria robusta]